MSSTLTPPNPPSNVLAKWPLVLIVGVLLSTLIGVGLMRLNGVSSREPDSPTVALRLLRFEDGPGGTVVVRDHPAGDVITTLSGEQGFVRGTLRALSRDRMRSGLGGPELPFELIGRADGRLTLRDPVTGQRVDLESFGPSHAGEFGRLLRPADQTVGTPKGMTP